MRSTRSEYSTGVFGSYTLVVVLILKSSQYLCIKWNCLKQQQILTFLHIFCLVSRKGNGLQNVEHQKPKKDWHSAKIYCQYRSSFLCRNLDSYLMFHSHSLSFIYRSTQWLRDVIFRLSSGHMKVHKNIPIGVRKVTFCILKRTIFFVKIFCKGLLSISERAKLCFVMAKTTSKVGKNRVHFLKGNLNFIRKMTKLIHTREVRVVLWMTLDFITQILVY